jgi:hypothetical protein
MCVPALSRMPTLFARAKPAFDPSSTTRTPAKFRAASTLASVDPLSTTTMSCGVAGGAARSDARHRSRSAAAL